VSDKIRRKELLLVSTNASTCLTIRTLCVTIASNSATEQKNRKFCNKKPSKRNQIEGIWHKAFGHSQAVKNDNKLAFTTLRSHGRR
jgi:hypothetical protein